MGSSKRKQGQRSLRFESLETRRALTPGSLPIGVAPVSDAPALQSTVESSSVDAFLRHIHSLDEIQIERDLPTPNTTSVVDRLIAETSPEDFG